MVVHLSMTEETHEKDGVFVPPKSHSYVIGVTLPQPTIRIKIPRVFVKAMQSRRNKTPSENGSKNMKKYWVTSKKSFGNKVGSMFSKVFGKERLVPETDSKAENVELHSNGEDGEMNKLKNMVERDNNDSIVANIIDSNVVCIVGEKGENTTIGTNGIVFLKTAGNFNDSPSFRSKTKRSRHGKLKTARWMKKMGRKTEKQELWKKRILMGRRCRPLE